MNLTSRVRTQSDSASPERFCRTMLAALGLLLAPALVGAAEEAGPDLEGFWTVQMGRAPSGTALLEKLPENAVLIDDAGGGELEAGDYAGLRLSERARREVAEYDFASEFSREFTCTPPSVAFYMQAPFPMEIHQGRDLIVLRMEYYDMVRVIFLDGRGHPPADAPHTKNGHSIGRWEGDELVVDTTHISAGTFMNNGFNHSDDIHMVERFKLSEDGATLWLTQLYEDPDTFEGLAARYMAWRREPGQYIYPYECDPSFADAFSETD